MTVRDQIARDAALDINDSIIVQAPAGSGKTGLLTQRFLALLAQASEPEEVLAITFTHKAAGEMRSRILGSLKQAETDSTPSQAHELKTRELARAALARDKALSWGLLESPGRLRVQTIDSLCASLTRQMPLLSAFGSQPAVTDDPGFLYAEAARKTLADVEAGENWSSHVEHLLRHLDNNLQRVEQLLASMLQSRDHWLRHVADSKDQRLQRKSLEKVLHEIVEEYLSDLHDRLPAELAEEIIFLAAAAADNLIEQGIDSPIHACTNLQTVPGSKVAHLPVWRGLAHLFLTGDNWRKAINKNQGFPPANKEAKRRMQDLLGQLHPFENFRIGLADLACLPDPGYSEEQWDILQAMIELLPVAVAHLRLVFRSHGMVDFPEIAQAAVQALGTEEQPTDLALALDYRVHHILVDEFQDTSLSQFQLLERLTADWHGEEGRSLFLVGDPMQSIYRFREAEVALYLRARHQGIGAISLTPLVLSVNFRSSSSLVSWFNRSFEKVFPALEDLTSGAVTYAPADAGNPVDGQEEAAVNVYPAFQDDREAEARQVVDIIRRLREQDGNQSIALLVRARTHLGVIVNALSEQGIGFRAVEIESLANRQPVIDLVSLTRALMHLSDRVAWISLLRAPWCGLTLQEIESLVGADPNAPVWKLLLESDKNPALSPATRTRLQRLIAAMNTAFEWRQTTPLSEWVEGAWMLLGGPATLTEPRDLSDCDQYFRLLQKLDGEGAPITVASLQTELQKLHASVDPDADERLQIMTVHKAKGLEFDAVIMPGLGRRAPTGNMQLLNWAERTTTDGQSDLIMAPISASGENRDSVNNYLRFLDRQREQNESIRLLYVAATRARRSLHLLGHTSIRDDELQKPVGSSLLSALWPAVERNFVEAMDSQAVQPVSEIEESGSGLLEVQGIRRLVSDWISPIKIEMDVSKQVPSDREHVEYSWVGPSARHIGTVVHRALEFIVGSGPENWLKADPDRLKRNIRNELVTLGVPLEQIDQAVETVSIAVGNSLSSERGRWILNNTHQDSECEYALMSSIDEDGPITSVIDRTFIDEGVRWIIDYKTSSHTGGGLDQFLDREMERYRDQLERYARAMYHLSPGPIKLGLYFPLLDGWREWMYSRE